MGFGNKGASDTMYLSPFCILYNMFVASLGAVALRRAHSDPSGALDETVGGSVRPRRDVAAGEVLRRDVVRPASDKVHWSLT